MICKYCNGRKTVRTTVYIPAYGVEPEDVPCPRCDGRGSTPD